MRAVLLAGLALISLMGAIFTAFHGDWSDTVLWAGGFWAMALLFVARVGAAGHHRDEERQ